MVSDAARRQKIAGLSKKVDVNIEWNG